MKNIITRKIEIRILDNQKGELTYKDVFKKLYEWQEIVFRAHNYVSTHMYIQKSLQEFFYFNDGFKLKLSKATEEDPDGVLNTSKQNTCYQLLSDKFKGDLPTDIMSNITSVIGQTFAKESKEYFSGKRSLRSYKRNVPMPFSWRSILKLIETEDSKNYQFNLFGYNFTTFFGRDLSGNKTIFDRGVAGEYKFCNSSIQLDGTKIYLLAVFEFESSKENLDPKKSIIAKLSIETPLEVIAGKKTISIGTKNEFLHRRIQIRHAMYRMQEALKYNTGGKGRKKKMQKIEDWESKEKNYVETRLHTYSRELIKIAIQQKAGTIYIDHQEELMKSLEEKIKEIKKDETLTGKEKYDEIEKAKFVLGSWSYYGLIQKIQYKAQAAGIIVENLNS